MVIPTFNLLESYLSDETPQARRRSSLFRTSSVAFLMITVVSRGAGTLGLIVHLIVGGMMHLVTF